MRLALPLALALVACGPGPERICPPDICEELNVAIDAARLTLEPELGPEATALALSVDVEVLEAPCLWRDEEDRCIAGHYDGSVRVGSTLQALLHEVLHHYQWTTDQRADHDWPDAWRRMDERYRALARAGFAR